MSYNRSRLLGHVLLAFGLCHAASAAEAPSVEELLRLDLEEILNLEVVSAARQAQRPDQTGQPVSIVTAEDIHYSGLTNPYEVLQFAPGVDMLPVDRNKYALGVRGLHDTWSDRTLSLVDGRVADSPLFGGSEFLRLPLLLADVRQIEVVRGPSGGAWGANAFNGAVNVITRSPEVEDSNLASVWVDGFGDNQSALRWTGHRDRWHWRLSGGYESLVSSGEALDRTFPLSEGGSGRFTSRDFRRNTLGSAAVTYALTEATTVSAGLGHADMEMGDYDFLYYWPQRDGSQRTTRAHAEVRHSLADDTTATVRWYGSHADSDWPSITYVDSVENHVEAQLDLVPAPRHHLSLGTQGQAVDIDQRRNTSQDAVLAGVPAHEQRIGLFGIDRWSVTPALDLEAQLYGEWYSETDTDWAGRVSALATVGPSPHRVVRISAGRAYRTPLIGLRGLSLSHLGGAARVLAGGDLANEQIASLEVGYRDRPTERTRLDLSAYWQSYRDLIGYVTLPAGYQPQNIGGARANGLEAEAAYCPQGAKLSVWYAYQWFETTGTPRGLGSTQEVRAFLPARHKTGTTLRIFLPQQWVVNLNGKYSSKTLASGPRGTDIPEFVRLDLTVAKQLTVSGVTGELLVGVADLFNDTERVVGDSATAQTRHVTPGRTFFLRGSLHF